MDMFHIAMRDEEIAEISNLGLAHLGDSVFELLVRSYLCTCGKETASGIHKWKMKYVTAKNQAKFALVLEEHLDQEEMAVFTRAKHASPHTYPKSCSKQEYRLATALEGLFGWLYLKGRLDRINELFQIILDEEDGK